MSIRRFFTGLLFALLLPLNSWAAIAYTGQCNGTTSCTISSGVASGDIVIAFAFRDGNNTAPTIPAGVGWNIISNAAGSNSNGAAFVWRLATGTSEASGTFTSATSLIMVSFSGANTTDVGGSGDAEGSSTTVRYPGVTMEESGGSSWILTCAGHRSANTSIDTDASVPSPASTTNKAIATDATDEAACWNTNGGVSSWSLVDVSVGGTSSGWRGMTIEIKEAAAVTDTPYDPFGMAGVFGT